MKKCIFTILFVMALINGISAQEQAFGLQLGYAQPTLREPNLDDVNLNYKSPLSQSTRMPGLKVGLVYEGTIIKGFGTYFALDYNFGTNIKKWGPVNPNQMTLMPQSRGKKFYQSLSLRSDWQYKFTVAKETYLLLYTGPVISVNLSMKEKIETKTGVGDEIIKTERDRYKKADDVDFDYSQLLRYNIQWGIGAGFQYQHYFVRGGYDFGLISEYKNKTYPRTDGINAKYHCRMDGWFVALGIYLWQSDK